LVVSPSGRAPPDFCCLRHLSRAIYLFSGHVRGYLASVPGRRGSQCWLYARRFPRSAAPVRRTCTTSGARKIAAPCTGLLESAARKGSRFGDSCNVLCLRLSPPSPYSRGRQRVMDAVLDIKRGVRRPFLGLWVREGVDPEPAREGVDKADHNCLSRLARRRATLRTPLAARTAPATTSNPLRTSRRRCRAPRSTWSWASTRALTRRWSTPPAPPACATSRSRTRAARWA
jgi:hypothetical protein